MKAALQHPSTCSACGQSIPYLGRRDLLQAMVQAAELLDPLINHELVHDLVAVRCRSLLARGQLREAIAVVNGTCPHCQYDTRRQPEKATPAGRCTVCGKEGAGVGPSHRCPVLGCAGSIASG